MVRGGDPRKWKVYFLFSIFARCLFLFYLILIKEKRYTTYRNTHFDTRNMISSFSYTQVYFDLFYHVDI